MPFSFDESKIRQALCAAGWSEHGVFFTVGGMFGSEGKGALAAALVRSIKFDAYTTNASVNSGHSAWVGADKVVTRQIPVGAVVHKTVYDEAPVVYLNGGAAVDHDILRHESGEFGIVPTVDPCAAVILPHHKEFEANPVSGAAKIASTAKGCGAAYADRINRIKDAYWGDVNAPYGKSGVVDLRDKSVLYEVAQGFSLGLLQQRFAPHTTSRNCTVQQAINDANLPLSRVRKVAMAVRTWAIRVGSTEHGDSGGMYPDQREVSWAELNLQPEYTTVTGRVRRVFTFSYDQFSDAIYVNEPDVININFMDYLPVCEREPFVRKLVNVYLATLPHKGHPVVLCGFGPKVNDMAVWSE